MQKTILPPQCLGVMGGGQLARMFAIAAKQMGYKVAIFTPDKECPAKYFADHHIIASYEDKNKLGQFAKICSVITTEFENVPAASLKYLNDFTPTYPNADAILIAQNRLKEKDFFNQLGIKTTSYYPINKIEDIQNINNDFFPAILKTNNFGYDGKGQIKVINKKELELAFIHLNKVNCILEKMEDLEFEASIILARNSFEIITYPISKNVHNNGILDFTISPAEINLDISNIITEASIKVVNKLDYIGVLAIEFFITKNKQVLANEIAPRPHNSGHHTIEANFTSQFEQQVRSICNLKLGETTILSNAIMLNLLGDNWQNNLPPSNLHLILSQYSNIKLHLYEKLVAKEKRKMGHMTIMGNNIKELLEQMQQIKNLL